ncbi:MAG: hypothetical protein ACOYUK_03120 [Patescibacteria group bacterium]
MTNLLSWAISTVVDMLLMLYADARNRTGIHPKCMRSGTDKTVRT